MQVGYQVADTATKRVRNGRHKVAKYDNPVANSKYCTDAGRMKLCFDSRKAAERFMAFNSEVILRQHGFAPVRSYRCPVCGCWHVTSKPRVGSVNDGKRHGKQTSHRKPISPVVRHNVQRLLNRMEHCVEAAFKAISLCDMKRVKLLCDVARQCYRTTLIVPGFEAQKQKLKDRLSYCLKVWADTRREWMRRLCHVDYRPVTVHYKQWYM